MTASRPRARSTIAVALTLLALVLIPGSPAAADTSDARARAVDVTLLDGSVVTSRWVTSSNDGTVGDDVRTSSESLSVLGGQSVVQAGVLTATAVARNDGTSAACSGLVGSGGSVTIGADDGCTVDSGTPGQVRIQLNSLTWIQADAVVASCTAAADGTVTSSTSLVNARVRTALATLISLDAAPAPNTGLTVAGLAELVLHQAGPVSGGEGRRTTALDVDVLGSLVAVRIGQVECGPNTTTVPVPIVPVAVWPFLAGAPVAAAGFQVRRSGSVPFRRRAPA